MFNTNPKMKFKKEALFKVIFVLFLFISFMPVSSFAVAGGYNGSVACPTGTHLDIVSSGCVPDVAVGQGSGGSSVICPTGTIASLICQIQQLLNSVVPLLLALGVVMFTWGVVQYVISDEEEAKSKGRDRIIYGVIGLAVILGIWGLVNLVVNTFGLGGSVAPDITKKLAIQSGSSSSCTGITLGSSKISDILDYFTCLIGQSVIPFIFAVATASFVWGLVRFFILGAEEEAKREQGKQFLLWGIIAIAVMISVWGLVKLFSNTFGISGSVLPTVQPNK